LESAAGSKTRAHAWPRAASIVRSAVVVRSPSNRAARETDQCSAYNAGKAAAAAAAAAHLPAVAITGQRLLLVPHATVPEGEQRGVVWLLQVAQQALAGGRHLGNAAPVRCLEVDHHDLEGGGGGHVTGSIL
jgi:hypothetical protein